MSIPQVAPGHRNGCWGRDFPGTNTAWLNSHVEYVERHADRQRVAVQILAPVTTRWRPGCGHDLRHQDPSCEGCKNVKGGDSDR